MYVFGTQQKIPGSVNSFGAIVARERQKIVRRHSATRRLSTNRGKTLRIGAKYSTNRGLSAWPLTLSLGQKIGIVSSHRPNFHHSN